MGSDTMNAETTLLRFAEILAGMPDLWHRALGQHSPDAAGWCLECRDLTGAAARWPCLLNRIAAEARQISDIRAMTAGDHSHRAS